MPRLLPAALLGLLLVGRAPAQCAYPVVWYPAPVYVPWYPLCPSVWGAPAPLRIPAAPVIPKAGVRETTAPVPRTVIEDAPKEPAKKVDGDTKDKEPRIPKPRLPLPDDPDDPPKTSPKKEPGKPDGPTGEGPKKEPAAEAVKGVDQFLVPSDRKRGEPAAEVRVGFFNHSDREIVLEVNGEAVKLPSEQYVTLRLGRTFTWAERGRKATDVVVPPDADGMEIVFRK